MRGFTLIELLVVVTIIGVLAAIVLTALNRGSNSANISRIEGQLNQARSAAEIYYVKNQRFGPAATGCTTANSLFVDPIMSKFVTSANYPSGATVACRSNTNVWAIRILYAPSGGSTMYYCMDGNGKLVKSASSMNISDSDCDTNGV